MSWPLILAGVWLLCGTFSVYRMYRVRRKWERYHQQPLTWDVYLGVFILSPYFVGRYLLGYYRNG